jgi:hypothetical protein
LTALRRIAGAGASVGLVSLGVAALTWSIYFGSVFWREAPLDRIVSRILRNENVSIDTIQKYQPLIAASAAARECRPRALHDAAIMEVYIVQIALENSDPQQLNAGLTTANRMIRRSLYCSPPDPFLWFSLFWIENLQVGFREPSIRYLDMSYQLGPYEGWIALKRNAFGLALLERLTPELRQRVISEFGAMVNSGFVEVAANNLTGPGWNVRDELIAGLSESKTKYRRRLAAVLRRGGVELPIPGVELPELRPWDGR